MVTKTGYEIPKNLVLILLPKPGGMRYEMPLGGRTYDISVPDYVNHQLDVKSYPRAFLYGKRGAVYGVLPFLEQPLADKGITCVYPVNPTRATGSTPETLRGLSIIHGADGKDYLTIL